jgi:hypothetical protein
VNLAHGAWRAAVRGSDAAVWMQLSKLSEYVRHTIDDLERDGFDPDAPPTEGTR